MKKGLKGKAMPEATKHGDMPGKPMAKKPPAAKLAPKKASYKDKPF